ncbi:MAG: hypothetical protein ACK4VV_16225 [Pseudomonas sp.]
MSVETRSEPPLGGPEQETTAEQSAEHQQAQEQLQAWMALGKQASEAGGNFVRLLGLELKLALGDGRRLILVALALVPVLCLAWFGLSVLLAWLTYQQSLSVTLALVVFLLVQIVAALLLARLARKFARSFSLPATRRHVQALKEGVRDGAQTTGK